MKNSYDNTMYHTDKQHQAASSKPEFEIDKTILVRCNSNRDHIVIPENVTHIKERAFLFKPATRLTIPKTVIELEDCAFGALFCLEQIDVDPENPRYESRDNCLIDKKTKTLLFAGNNAIIPDDGSVVELGSHSMGESACKHLVIPKSVTKIGYDLRRGNCPGIETITVQKDNPVYHSAGNCLIHTESKTLLLGSNRSVIPDDGSVTVIGSDAFDGCPGLTEIHIPSSVKVIKSGAFLGCAQLETVTFSEGLLRIEEFAFGYCKKLTTAKLPKSLEELEDMAFHSCDGLRIRWKRRR